MRKTITKKRQKNTVSHPTQAEVETESENINELLLNSVWQCSIRKKSAKRQDSTKKNGYAAASTRQETEQQPFRAAACREKCRTKRAASFNVQNVCERELPLSLSCRFCCCCSFFWVALHTCPGGMRRCAVAFVHASVCARMCQLTCPVISNDFYFRFILHLRHLLQLCSTIFGRLRGHAVAYFQFSRNGYVCVRIWDSKWMLASFIARVHSHDLLSTILF